MKDKILKIIFHPKFLLFYLDRFGFIRINDKKYIEMQYELVMNKKLDFNNLKTYNEKLQYLKLHDRKDIYTILVDKYEVKKFLLDVIGDEYIIPTLGIYDNFDDIDFSKLPNKFVIKCTHDSGGIIICKNKDSFDYKKARKKIKKCLKHNFFYDSREWPYKNVKPRIMIEKHMMDKTSDELIDYKFYCFDGKPEILVICSNRFKDGGLKESYFDCDFNKIDVLEGGHPRDEMVKKPYNFEKMKQFASILSKNIKQVRIDFYEINNKLYFGEITFFSSGGYEKFDPESFNYKLGEFIKLEGEKNENFNCR